MIGDQSGSGKVAGEGRREEAGSQKSKDDEGGSVRLAKNPYIIVRGYWRPDSPSGCKQGPLRGCLFLTSQVTCLRESCTRENRTCSLGGGRRPARKRASSDPTIHFICRAEPPGDQRLGFFRRPDWRRICRCFLAASSFPSLSTSGLSGRVCLAQFRGRRARRRAASDGCA